MSRVAKAHIELPANVDISVNEGTVTVKGPNGTLSHAYHQNVSIKADKDNAKVFAFKPTTKDPRDWAFAGTVRAIVNNMVHGVTNQFQKTLELVGVGYRVSAKGDSILNLSLGFSHPVEYKLPAGVKAVIPNVTTLTLQSIDKQLLGQVAAEIRALRPPEPYKGKGVRYQGERLSLKEAKKK